MGIDLSGFGEEQASFIIFYFSML